LLLSTTSCGDILPVSRSVRLVDVVALNDSATITVAVRAPQNLALLRRGGATSVITSSESADRLLVLPARSPATSGVIGDLRIRKNRLRLVGRPVRPAMRDTRSKRSPKAASRCKTRF
jgi:hypothetical protein